MVLTGLESLSNSSLGCQSGHCGLYTGPESLRDSPLIATEVIMAFTGLESLGDSCLGRHRDHHGLYIGPESLGDPRLGRHGLYRT